MEVGHSGQPGVIVQLTVTAAKERVHVNVINQQLNVTEQFVKGHHHNLNHATLNRVQALYVQTVKYGVTVQTPVMYRVQLWHVMDTAQNLKYAKADVFALMIQ